MKPAVFIDLTWVSLTGEETFTDVLQKVYRQNVAVVFVWNSNVDYGRKSEALNKIFTANENGIVINQEPMFFLDAEHLEQVAQKLSVDVKESLFFSTFGANLNQARMAGMQTKDPNQHFSPLIGSSQAFVAALTEHYKLF